MYKLLFLAILILDGCDSHPTYHNKVQKASQYDTIIIDSCEYSVLRVDCTLIKK